MNNSFAYGYIINYNSEIFPVYVRGFTLGISLFIGRLLMSVFPFVNNLIDVLKIHRLSPVLPFTFVTFLLCFALPETYNEHINKK